MSHRRTFILRAASLVALAGVFSASGATAAVSDDTKVLQAEIQNRKAAIESINQKLEEYKKKINEYAKKSASLMNDIALLENEMAMAELDIAATQTEIEASQLELQMLTEEIDVADEKLAKQKAMLADLVFALHTQDSSAGVFELVLGAKSFEDVFRAAADLEAVNTDLKKTLGATQQARSSLQDKVARQDEKLSALQELEGKLEAQVGTLEGRRNAKEVLAFETQESESEYRVLMSELRQEQQSISSRIAELQNQIENKLAEEDASGDLSTISWPVRGRITTTFYDPTYPFRHLFEHSGLDIAIPQGTAVGSAAPGVVAWARTGRMYGNYVMIIHADGKATLYAHLSRIDVEQDQYVGRGETIGLSGGRPGTPGAGFSTGPHLHFELRQDGIPVNPMTFLPD